MQPITIIGIVEKSYLDERYDKNHILIIRCDEKRTTPNGEVTKSQFYKVQVYGKDGPSSPTHRSAQALQPGQWVCLKDVKISGREYQGNYYVDFNMYGRPMRLLAADGTVQHTQPPIQPPPPKPTPPQNGPGANVMTDDEIPF